jgi:hypothetical protein
MSILHVLRLLLLSKIVNFQLSRPLETWGIDLRGCRSFPLWYPIAAPLVPLKTALCLSMLDDA